MVLNYQRVYWNHQKVSSASKACRRGMRGSPAWEDAWRDALWTLAVQKRCVEDRRLKKQPRSLATWILYGLYMDFVWMFYGFCMDFTWILYGLYGFVCFLFGWEAKYSYISQQQL